VQETIEKNSLLLWQSHVKYGSATLVAAYKTDNFCTESNKRYIRSK